MARRSQPRGIRRLWADDELLPAIRELAETGASLSVIEAKVGLREGVLRRWLNRGKNDNKGPYNKFYVMFRSWVADATLTAQQTMLIKTPEKWLERNTAGKIVDDGAETSLTGSKDITDHSVIPGMTMEKCLEALKVLKEQGLIDSIDKVVEQGRLPLVLSGEFRELPNEEHRQVEGAD